MNMKKKHIILLLIAGCTITAAILQFFEMSLTIPYSLSLFYSCHII